MTARHFGIDAHTVVVPLDRAEPVLTAGDPMKDISMTIRNLESVGLAQKSHGASMLVEEVKFFEVGYCLLGPFTRSMSLANISRPKVGVTSEIPSKSSQGHLGERPVEKSLKPVQYKC